MVSPEFFPKPSGLANYVYYLSKTLVRRGHDVTIITRGGSRGYIQENVDEIRVIKAWFAPLYPFHVHLHGIFVNNLINSLRNQFDLIHAHSALIPVVKTSLPLITTIHSAMKSDVRLTEVRDFRSLLLKILEPVCLSLEKHLLSRSDLITAVSRSVALQLQEYGVNVDDVFVLGNGVDDRLFTSNNKHKSKNILCVTRMAPGKGLFDLLECAEIVCKEHVDVRFVIVGDGPFRSSLIRMAYRKGLGSRFLCVGYRGHKSLVRFYQDAVIYVIPSYHEGLPTTVLEAMACNLPVVGTSVPGTVDIVEQGNTGFLVPVKSPSSMAKAIITLLSDKHLRYKMGSTARKIIEKNYTWDVVADRAEKLYFSFLEGDFS